MTLGRHSLCKKYVILNWSAAEVKNLVMESFKMHKVILGRGLRAMPGDDLSE